MKKRLLIVALGLTGIISCTPEVELPEVGSGSANVARFMVIGDSYMSGYSDGALYRGGQEKSIGGLIHRSLTQSGSGVFTQALMPEGDGLGRNAKYWVTAHVSKSKLGDRTDCEGVVSMGPVKREYSLAESQPYLDAISVSGINDLSVPFMTLAEFVNNTIPSGNEYAERFCSSCTGGMMDKVTAYQPTFFALWSGMEEVYRYARNGGFNSSLPSVASFESSLDTVLTKLQLLGAKGVLATIPDFRSMPYYSLIPWNGAELAQDDADSLTQIYIAGGMNHISFVEGKNGFVIADPSATGGFRQLVQGEYITLSAPLDSMKCYYYGVMINPIHDRYVLDSSEVAQIESVIDQFNQLIVQKAQQYDLALVDMHSYFESIVSGVQWNGVTYTPEFVSGGFYSLDGFHPTQKGANLLANQFIRAMNAKFGSTFPTIYCADCNGVLFP